MLIWLHVELSAHCRYFIFRALYKRARVHCAFYNRFMFSVVFGSGRLSVGLVVASRSYLTEEVCFDELRWK